MSLSAGNRLGPYEILGALGAGGMGEVYKARDTRLDRLVAIKILPAQFASNPELRSRFEREARTVSSLDHPNICALHDVGRGAPAPGQEPVEFLVMQYLVGETLATRLARGPLPLPEALRYGVEIASALDKAHGAGILHRDLKPGNVMLSKSGASRQGAAQAKLLDFGLAKIAATGRVETAQQTLTSPLTGQGTILGTLHYMAPEQLEGRDVDVRSDIFAFGAVLYEMVTASRAFDGSSQATIIAAILDRDPPPMAQRAPLTPPALERVVHKCLAKDPDRRWQSARDLCDELSWISQGSGVDLAPTVRSARPVALRPWLTTAAVALGALLLGGVLGWVAFRTDVAPASLSRQLNLSPTQGAVFTPGGIAAAPDGRSIAYVAAVAAAPPRIHLRKLDSDTTTVVAGTDNARAPFFSPDSLWIGYFTNNALMKVSVLGGAPVKVFDVPPVTRGGTWGRDDAIIMTPTPSDAMLQVSAGGMSPPRGLVRLAGAPAEKIQRAELWPSLLPDGSAVIFTRRRGTSRILDDADVVLQDLKSGAQKLLTTGGGYARYSPTGHVLFVRGDTLMAIPFDARRRETTGTALPVVEGIAVDPDVGGAHYAVAPDGTLFYLRGTFGERRAETVWVERSGAVVPAPSASALYMGDPRISPDGKRVLFKAGSVNGDSDVYVTDVGRWAPISVSGQQVDDFAPVWGHDATRIIYTSFSVGSLPQIVSQAVNGGAAEAIVPLSEAQFGASVSPDGLLAYTVYQDDTYADVYVVPLGGDRKGRRIVSTAASEYGAEFSPDGRWLAYISNESGSHEIYVIPYPGPGPKRLVSRGGGVAPLWCRGCSELFYQSAAGLMSVPITPGAQLDFGEPRVLFTGSYSMNSTEDGHRDYDAMPGGKRFLMMRPKEDPAKTLSMEVLIDWVGRLRGTNGRGSGR